MDSFKQNSKKRSIPTSYILYRIRVSSKSLCEEILPPAAMDEAEVNLRMLPRLRPSQQAAKDRAEILLITRIRYKLRGRRRKKKTAGGIPSSGFCNALVSGLIFYALFQIETPEWFQPESYIASERWAFLPR